MNKLKLLLSIQELDSEFSQMIETLKDYVDVDVVNLNDYSLKDYDIFVSKKLDIDKLKDANKLKIIFAYKTGVDDFPLSILKEKGITLVNTHANAKIIAQYAFSLATSLVININKLDYNLRRGIWYDKEIEYWQSIFSMKIGLLGYGHIGKEIYKLLKQNNIETYTIDRGHEYPNNLNLVNSLDELIDKSDLIICSLPKTYETNNIFTLDMFKKMKNKYLVNVGRSNIINQEDLYIALSNDYIKGAAIDTWDNKPKNKDTILPPSKYPINELFNCLLSPHAAMKVKDGHLKYVQEITNSIIDYVNNKPLINVVDLNKGY